MITRDKIAVLIPVYNESPVISRTIKSLLNTGVNRKDVFVVDDLSTDNTAEKARSLGVNVFTVLENCGKADAQIAALAHFGLIEKYDWIVFLDGDSRVESQFLQAVIKSIDEFPYVALFVGQVKSVKNDHLYSAYRAFEYTFSHALSKSAQNNFNVVYVSPGCASIYRSDILNKLEIDNLTLAEDMDLTIQVHRLGGSVKYIKEAGVLTQDPNNFKDYHKQILRWYRGFWQVIKKHSVFGRGPKNWVDLYILMIIADAVLFNRIVYVIGLIFLFPNVSIWGMTLDVFVSFAIACWCAFKTRRLDVVYKFPIYYWISYLNFYALARSYFEIIVFKKTILAWNKVARYDASITTR